jgi:hypothetical protein
MEITVKVCDDEQTLTQKFLSYEKSISISHDDPVLKSMVEQTIAKFKGNPTDVIVKIKYTW